MEAESITYFEPSNHGIWLRNFVTRLHMLGGIERPLKIYYDNKSTIMYSNNNKSFLKSKDVDIKFLIVKERVQSGQVFIEHIGTNSVLQILLLRDLHPRSSINTLLVWVSYC